MDAELLSGTPANTGRDERRETILKVAYAAFLNEGYAATSMSGIAARVGGSKATLYYYFASKEELFLAVIDEKCRDAHAVIADVLADAGDFFKTLLQLTDTLIRMILEDDRIAIRRLITAEAARFSELGRGFYACGREKGIETLTGFFEGAQQAGALKPGRARDMVMTYVSLCEGELMIRKLWNVNPDPAEEEIEAAIDNTVSVFLAAYGV
jgi:AcrR family transcriptional regulator